MKTSCMAMTVPSVRIAVVCGFPTIGDDPDRDDLGVNSEIIHVVAIRSRVETDGEDEENELLVWEPGLNAVVTLSEAASNFSCHRVVLCFWPQSEDAERLAPDLAEMKSEAQAQLDGRKVSA
jgi:hypothetical protein